MLDVEVIQRSIGPWASCVIWCRNPLVDGDRAAAIVVFTRSPQLIIMGIQNFSARLSAATVSSKLDLVRVYQQVPVAEKEPAMITLFDLFEFLGMPFGLKNASQAF